MSDAHEAIRNLLGRYCELMDAGDFAGLAELFAEATLADEQGRVFATGADEVRAMWDRQTIRYDGSPRTRHITANPVIEVTGDTATCRSSYVVFQATDTLALQPIVAGRYVDEFAVDEFARDSSEGWHWTQRRYIIDQVGDLSHHLR